MIAPDAAAVRAAVRAAAARLRGPLPLAGAVALGVAIAPAVARAGLGEPARWAIALALIAAAGLRWPGLALAAGLAVGAARGAPPPAPLPAGVEIDDRAPDRVEGEILGPVARTAVSYGARLAPIPSAATAWVWTATPVAPGERVIVTGLARSARGSRGLGHPDPAAALAARGAAFELTARTVERVEDAPGAAAHLWRWAARAQASWSAAIERAGGGDADARAALRGLSVGDRTAVPPTLDARWRAAGIYHVLSVSGLHLAIVAGLAFALLRRVAAASPWGGRAHPARLAAPPALALAVAYTLLTGAQLPTLRALLVAGCVLGAAALDRPVRFLDALGAAALVLLVLRPADLLDPGFQLSFTAALTLAGLPRRGSPPGSSRGRRAAHALRRAIAASLWVTLATAPITAFHFHEIAPGGVIGNVVFAPPLELLALPLALGGLAAGWDAPVAAASAVVAAVDGAVAHLAPILPVATAALVGALLPAALALTAVALASRRWRTRADAAAWAALCAGWALGRAPAPAGALRVTFLDVGQGDATLIELPDGGVWLVDAGGHPGARTWAAATAPGRVVRRALAAAGHHHLDAAFISHPHPDHFLGLTAVGVPIREVWWAPAAAPDARPPRAHPGGAALPSFSEVVAAAIAAGARPVAPALGVVRARAGATLVAWGPRYRPTDDSAPVLAADPVRSVNDNSLVLELRFAGRTVLLTGDLEAEGEAELTAARRAAGAGRVDVVKVPHHGSATSSSPELVGALAPALAVISCGRGNSFGLPAASVIAAWAAAGAEIARTDRDGAVTVTISADGALAVDRAARAGPAPRAPALPGAERAAAP